MANNDDLARVLAKELNQQNKEGKIAFILGEGDSPTVVSEFISTGCTALDYIIANRPNGGIPVGKITEIAGLQATGKSLLAAHILAETQRRGGVAIMIDNEAATDPNFWEAIGIDTDKLLWIGLDVIEDILQTIENLVISIREKEAQKKTKDRKLVTIVVDSVAGAMSRQEVEASYDKEGYGTGKALAMSKGLRKLTNLIARERIALVFTNQLRQRIGVAFGDPYDTPGGKALPFHSSVRLRLLSIGKIKDGDKIIGVKTKVRVHKNRLGPPHRECEFEIFFKSGIDDAKSLLDILEQYDLITKEGRSYIWNGEKKTIKIWKDLLRKDSKLKGEMVAALEKPMVLKYAHQEGFKAEEGEIELPENEVHDKDSGDI